MAAWYASFPGQSMLAELRLGVAQLLHKTYGYHAAQVGILLEHENLLQNAEFIHPFSVSATLSSNNMVMADTGLLPLSSRSLDCVVLLHSLDISPDPYRLLREVDRVLAADGHLIIVGFNPVSNWGLVRILMFWRRTLPWCLNYYSLYRLRDWLRLLGYSLQKQQTIFFQPPLKSEKILKRLGFLQHVKKLLPLCGAVYLVKARKQTIPLTLEKKSWWLNRKLVPGGLVQSRRNVSNYEEN